MVVLRVNLQQKPRAHLCVFLLNFCRNVTELHHHSPLLSPSFFSLFSPQMQRLCYLAVTFLCTLCFAPLLHSLECNETQYRNEHGEQRCCDKCRPGTATPATQTHQPHGTGHTNTNVHGKGYDAELKATRGLVCVPRSLLDSALWSLLSDQVRAV